MHPSYFDCKGHCTLGVDLKSAQSEVHKLLFSGPHTIITSRHFYARRKSSNSAIGSEVKSTAYDDVCLATSTVSVYREGAFWPPLSLFRLPINTTSFSLWPSEKQIAYVNYSFFYRFLPCLLTIAFYVYL